MSVFTRIYSVLSRILRRPARKRRRLWLEALERREVLSMAMGMNLDRVADFNANWMFTDAFLSSRDWQSYGYNTVTRELSFGTGGSVHVDQHGWPTQLNQWTNEQGQPMQQQLGTLMFDGIDGHYPAGNYRAEWQGTGTLAWAGDAHLAEQGLTADGGHYAVVNVAAPTRGGIAMRIETMSSADPIRDVHVSMPDYQGQSFVGQVWRPGASFSPFHPLFRERLDPFDTIRFQQPARTITSDIVHWDDRSRLDDARQSDFANNFQNGLAPEYMIELCNELHANAWFDMPYLADDDYVRHFATLVRDTLAPGLKVYVEWSNEVWNFSPGYESFQWVTQQMALPENAGLSFYQIWAREAKRDFDICSDVFAGQSDRLVRVVAGQAASVNVAAQVLANMEGAFDAVSCDGYVTFAQPQLLEYRNHLPSVDQVVSDLFNRSLPNTLTFLQNHQNLADQYSQALGRNIQLIVYEGGPLLNGGGQPFEQTFLQAAQDPHMYGLYEALLRGAEAVGVDMFAHYVYTDTSPFGDASALRWQDQPLADAPKYRALLDAVSGELFTPEFSVEAVTPTADEHGQQPATLRVSRTGSADLPLQVSYQLGGTARANDYTGLPATISFAAGERSKLITITPVDDTRKEGDEQLILTLTAGAGYRVGAASNATIRIRDDDILINYDLPIQNPSFETGNLSGWTLAPATQNFSTVVASTSDPVAPTAAHQGRYFVWGGGPTGSQGGGANPAGVSQRIDLSAHAAGIDRGKAQLTFSGWGAGGGSGQQSAFLELHFLDAAGNQIGATLTSNRADARGVWTQLTVTGTVPIGTRSVELRAMTQRPTNFFANRAGFDGLAGRLVYADLAPINQAPSAASDTFVTDEDTSLTIAAPGILSNDGDPDGDPLSAVLVGGVSHGSLVLAADGSVRYTPAANFNGSDQFTYRASDGDLQSEPALVTIVVNPVNDAPVLDALADSSLAEGSVLTLTARAADVDGDRLTFTLDDAPARAVIDPVSGVFTWYAADGPATRRLTVRVTDNGSPALSTTQTFVITVANVAPRDVAVMGPASGVRGQPLAFSGRFTDPGPLDTHTMSWAVLDGISSTVGGSGRDLMIGGAGSDRLVGNAGDDILIAALTAFDRDDAALARIMDEWTSARDYTARVATLRQMLRSTGPTATLFDDAARDMLTGSADQDWFCANLDAHSLRALMSSLSRWRRA